MTHFFKSLKKNKVVDPVCGRKFKIENAYVVIHYEGEQYYLCSAQCQSEFKQSPDIYSHPKEEKSNNLDY